MQRNVDDPHFLYGALESIYLAISMMDYPDKGALDRINHNGGNHLRSVANLAHFLKLYNEFGHQSFNNLVPNDIVLKLVLLSAMFKSLLRVNEDSGPFIDFLVPYAQMRNLLGGFTQEDRVYADDKLLLTNQPSLASGILFAHILEQLDIPNSVRNFSTVKALPYGLSLYLSSNDIIKDADPDLGSHLLEVTKIVNLGHYADHCRWPMRWSQFDTKIELNKYVSYITKWNPKATHDMREKLYDFEIQLLGDTGFDVDYEYKKEKIKNQYVWNPTKDDRQKLPCYNAILDINKEAVYTLALSYERLYGIIFNQSKIDYTIQGFSNVLSMPPSIFSHNSPD